MTENTGNDNYGYNDNDNNDDDDEIEGAVERGGADGDDGSSDDFDLAAMMAAAEVRRTERAAAAEAAQEARPRRHRDRPRRETEPASGWIEDVDLYGDRHDSDTLEDQDRRAPIYTRQVCVRLSGSQHSELSAAAGLYGVAPGTMARILVRRGARAVLDHHRRYDLEQDRDD